MKSPDSGGKIKRSLILGAAFFAFWLPGCTINISEPVGRPPAGWEQSHNTHPKAAQLQQLLDDYIAKGFPGLVMYVESPQGTWNGAAGYARIETRERMTPDHLFPSGSNAKPYTAVAVMLLVEDGRIDLDAKINRYLPRTITDKIGNGNTATVRQLLNHTSGIRDFIGKLSLWLDFFNDPSRQYSPAYSLERISGDPPDFPAGRQYAYSNTNYLLLALLMDHVLGTSHADFITERILRPLRFEHTYYKNQPGYPSPAGLVNGYSDMRGNGQLTNISDYMLAGIRNAVGNGGYVASSRDYAQFLEAVLHGDLLKETSLREMMQVMPGSSYGFGGFGVSRTRFGRRLGHTGDMPGAQTLRFYYLDQETFIVLLANGIDLGEQGRLNDLFDVLSRDAEDVLFK